MTDTDLATAAFTPAVGMVDRLDSRGFGPSADELAFVAAYLSPEEMDMAALMARIPPEALAARERRKADRRARDWPALSQYRDANTALTDQAADVVFIGDSITEFWAYAQPDLFEGGVVNRGISGQTSPQILLRFMADVVALKPKAVHLMCGVNDIAGNTGPTTLTDYCNNILAMTALARAHDIRMILASLTPVSPEWRPTGVVAPGDRIRQINAWLADLASDRNLIFADYTSVLSDTSGDLRPTFHRDGLHPGAEGYAAMRPVAEKALSAALRAR
jgi:lysophospholipase L1-like esterase